MNDATIIQRIDDFNRAAGEQWQRDLADLCAIIEAVEVLDPICPDCGHPRSDHDDGECPPVTAQETDR
jgi:hypothetical protein